MQVAANFANDNKFILIANTFLITLVLTCLLCCQSSALIYVLCGKTLSHPSSLVAAAESDFTFLVTQLSGHHLSKGRERPAPPVLLESRASHCSLEESRILRALATWTKEADIVCSKLCF